MIFSHSAVVEAVEYSHYTTVDQDHETGEEKVLVIVHMPSGQDNRKIEVKIHEGGMRMSIFEVYPSIFLNANYVRKQSTDLQSTHAAKLKAFASFITSKLLATVHGKLADKVLKEMQVDLPVPCEEVPTSHNRLGNHVFGRQDFVDAPVVLHEHNNPSDPSSKQKVLLLYIELVGKHRQERLQIGRGSSWRDESDSESENNSDSDSDSNSNSNSTNIDNTPVFNNNATKKSSLKRWFEYLRGKRTNPPSKAPHEDVSPSPSAPQPSTPPLDSADYSYNPDTFNDIDDFSTIKTRASTSYVSGMKSMMGLGVVSEDESTAVSKSKLSKASVY